MWEAPLLSSSDNTLTFPDPSRRALMRMIWPERN